MPFLAYLRHNLYRLYGFTCIGISIAGWLLISLSVTNAQDNAQLNVLLVVFDDLNIDIGCYGNAQVKTPNLDAFAKRSVRFENAHCNGPYCAPSRTSFITGLYPSTTEIYRGERYYEIERTKHLKSIFSHFKDSVYDVYGVGKLFHANWDPVVVDRQFDEFFKPRTAQAPKAYFKGRAMRHPGNPRIREKDSSNGSWGPLSDVPNAETYGPGWEGWGPYRYVNENDRDPLPDEQSTNWAIERCNRPATKPFFLSIGYLKPHTPLYAPQKFFDLYEPAKLKMRPVLKNDLDDVIPVMRQTSMYSEMWTRIQAYSNADEIWRDYYRAYLATISHVDDEFGKLMAALKAGGHFDNTIVIVVSDHGYHFGDKQRIGKGSPWNGTTRIPMMVRVPELTREGGVCSQPVSLIDLYPTLLDLCGLPEHPHGDAFPLDGTSLAPLLADVNASWDGPTVAYNNCYSDAWTVCDARYRYILDPDGNEELYDLKTDPNEWHNVVGQESLAPVRADLHDKLLKITKGKRPLRQ